jgi:hypothetical protein
MAGIEQAPARPESDCVDEILQVGSPLVAVADKPAA